MLCKETESQHFQWVGGGNVRIHRRAVFGCGRAAGGYVVQLCKGRGASLAAGVETGDRRVRGTVRTARCAVGLGDGRMGNVCAVRKSCSGVSDGCAGCDG